MNPIYKFSLAIKKDSTTNLFNPKTVTREYYVNWITGELSFEVNYISSDFISVNPNSIYKGLKSDNSNYEFRCLAFYRSDKTFISGLQYSTNFTTPANTYYVRVTYRLTDIIENCGLFIGAINTFEYYDSYITKNVIPNYKDDLAKEYGLETGQRFYRVTLSGKFSFIRDEYDYIVSQPFETEFLFIVEKSDDGGATWVEYYRGKFMKTDCKFDDDNKKIVASMDTLDEYLDVMAGLEKEYNLTKLAPQIMPLIIRKRPLIQIYMPGDSVVSCFLGGTYWEQDANAVSDLTALVNTYHFALCNKLREINITVSGTPVAANGLYVGGVNKTTGYGTLYPNTNNGYRLTIGSFVYDDGMGGTYSQDECRIIRISDSAVMFSAVMPGAENADFTLAAVTGTGTAAAELATYNVYARYLLDVDTIQGLNTYALPTDDIVENNRNYRRAIGYAIDVGYISNNESTTPTEWGLKDNGKYFSKPYSIYSQEFFPIARSTWRYASLWFGFYMMDWLFEQDGRKPYILRDTYPIGSAIKVLLAQFAPDITHEETAEYSQFLYGDINPITYQKFKVLISQKSNVLVGNYDQPAQKDPITLQQITNMLRDCFRCFWYIEDGKFKIEHIEFFRNGGTYSGTPIIGTDLTVLENVKNAKKWGFKTSAYDYDKADLAERYQFAWSDDVTPSFTGVPIEILSKYVSAGKIENVTVGGFTTDIDYMILNPGEISNDGFALFAAVPADALLETDAGSYFGGGSAASGQYGDKKYRLNTLLNGKVANLIGSTYADTAGSIDIVFFDSSNNQIAQTRINILAGQNDLDRDLTIPENAYYIGYKSVVIPFSYSTYYMYVAGNWELPFVTRSFGDSEYIMQNGYMSWVTLQPNYYMYDLPATHVKINETETYALGIEKKKKQTVEYPSIDDPDPLHLVKTYIGNGQIDKISINLHSRMNKITLKYDTE